MTRPLRWDERKIGFWLNVEKEPDEGKPLGGCWLWRGSLTPGGYGCCTYRGKTMGAHQASWEMAFGPRRGLFVLHKCDVRHCVRPSHLFLGTHQENMADMYAKGRGPTGEHNGSRTKPWRRAWGDRNGSRTCPESRERGDAHWTRRHRERCYGESNAHCVLSDEAVAQLRVMGAEGFSQEFLAATFGISQGYCSLILRNKRRVGVLARIVRKVLPPVSIIRR